MPYLIDGSNFLGHTVPSNFRSLRSKYELIAKLLIFQRRKKTRVILVFDGRAEPGLMDEKFQKKKFSVIHPPLDQNADSLIKEIISKQTDLRRFFVVSSDHEIKSFARSKRAKSISCKEFNRELKTALKENKIFLETQKKAVSLSPLEISQWFEIFSSKK